MSDLKTVIKQVIQKVEKHRDLYSRSEQSVREQLINPILKALGWDASEPDFVHANVTNDDGRIPDYTLLKDGSKKLILEAKKLSRNLDDGKVIRQLADYCYPHGIEFGILTDGVVWQLFDTFEKNPSNRIVWTIDVSQYQEQELIKLEMLHYDKIEYLEEELKQTKELDAYLSSILSSKDNFLTWAEFHIKDKFIKDNKHYKYKEEVVQKHISQQLDRLVSTFIPTDNEGNKEVLEIKEALIIKSPSDLVDKQYRHYDLNAPFDLAFTKILDGHIGNETAKNWKNLLHILVRQLHLSGKPMKDIGNLGNLNIKQGVLFDNGFHKVEDTPYSLQNVDANKAVKALLIIAKKYGIQVEIKFIWRDKPGEAAFPNEFGKIVSN